MLIYVLRWRPSSISDRHKTHKFVKDLPMIIPGQFGFNCLSGFREETFWNQIWLKPNCTWMFIGWSSTKFLFFYANRKFKMAAKTGHKLTLDPMRKCSNAFFSETTNMNKAKLYMNVHWMVLYNLQVFCSDLKFKMVATAELNLTLNPMGKMFQKVSSFLGQFGFNCPSGFR
jgi:hypothetical protein